MSADPRDMKLTVLKYWIDSVLYDVRGGFTLRDRMRNLGVPIDRILEDVPPLSCPPYTRDEFRAMTTDLAVRTTVHTPTAGTGLWRKPAGIDDLVDEV